MGKCVEEDSGHGSLLRDASAPVSPDEVNEPSHVPHGERLVQSQEPARCREIRLAGVGCNPEPCGIAGSQVYQEESDRYDRENQTDTYSQPAQCLA